MTIFLPTWSESIPAKGIVSPAGIEKGGDEQTDLEEGNV